MGTKCYVGEAKTRTPDTIVAAHCSQTNPPKLYESGECDACVYK
jgi:hypothetical protein